MLMSFSYNTNNYSYFIIQKNIITPKSIIAATIINNNIHKANPPETPISILYPQSK